MNWPECCAVVIPCLNEGGTIGPLVQETLQHLPSVFVVDDGSSDLTADHAASAGATVLRHPRPMGKGIALRDGFRAALRNGFSWAIAMDGDGQHLPSNIPDFFEAAENSAAAMIIGNRMPHCQRMPLIRRLVNRWMSRAISQFCAMDLPDSQCGFRLIHLDAWRAFDFSAERFEIESELLVRFVRAGLRVQFVPTPTRYAAEKSKIRPIQDTIRWFRWWYAIRKELSLETAPNPRYGTLPQDATA